MSYYIDIIDKESPDTKLDYRFASASGITLEWNGGDAKDEVLIVGTNLKYDILTTTAEDLAFIEFFTGNENRYLVQVKSSATDAIIWQGFMLPDQYSEPYQNGAFFVSFIASCGLGRLKGKYLPEEYYEREKSVIDILCQILKQTNLGLDVLFAPAIENFSQKNWDQIYIDTANFKDKEKKKDSYSLLETLLKDTLCIVYQADNCWYIEGMNLRHLRQVNYKKYDQNGVFVANVVYNRLLKTVKALVTPLVTVIPPYNQIEIKRKKTEPALPKTITKEKNDGWAVVTGVKGEVYSTDWIGHNGYHAKATAPNYEVRLFTKSHDSDGATSIAYPHDDTKFISLKQKLYFAKSEKINIKLKFNIPGEAVPSNMNLWRNPFKYEIVFNGEVLRTNWGTTPSDSEILDFKEGRESELNFEMIMQQEGLLDIKLWRPFGKDDDTKITNIIINTCEVSVIGFEEDESFVDLINDEFTIDKEVELTFADDKSGFSEGFRLEKLKEETSYNIPIQVPILYGFQLNGKNYSVVQLEGANLIKDNLYQVFRSGVNVVVNDVVYNFNDGEQMVVETSVFYATGTFEVKKFAIDDHISSRGNWVRWTDAVYKIENNPYAKTIANIYRRLFSVAIEKIDMTVLNAVKFNDLIVFNYVGEKNFHPLNVVWNLDENKSELRLGRCFYRDSGTDPGDDNVPPIVVACDDVFINDGDTVATISATAYDPDGFIVLQNWTKIAGGFGDVIVSPVALETQLENLTEDFYTYQIQVTDDDGASAVDSVNIIRKKNYTLTFQETFYDRVEGSIAWEKRELKLICTPELPDNFLMNIKGELNTIISLLGQASGWDAYTGYHVEKNGAIIEQVDIINSSLVIDLVLSYIKGDDIKIYIEAQASSGAPSPGYYATASMGLEINEAEFIQGQGTILGLPIVYAAQAQVTSE